MVMVDTRHTDQRRGTKGELTGAFLNAYVFFINDLRSENLAS